jgi:hypothetical protein
MSTCSTSTFQVIQRCSFITRFPCQGFLAGHRKTLAADFSWKCRGTSSWRPKRHLDRVTDGHVDGAIVIFDTYEAMRQ